MAWARARACLHRITLQAGAKLYARECAACHGSNLEGIGKAPPLNQAEVYDAPPGVLFWILRNGSLRRGMPSFAHLPEPQRWQIINFIRSQNRAEGGNGGASSGQAPLRLRSTCLEELDQLEIGEPGHFRNLTLFPLLRKPLDEGHEYILLEDAIQRQVARLPGSPSSMAVAPCRNCVLKTGASSRCCCWTLGGHPKPAIEGHFKTGQR